MCYGEHPAEDSVGEEVVEEKETGKSIGTENKENSKPINENEVNNQLVFDTSKVTKFMAPQKTIDESISITVIADEVVCSPPRKNQKEFDEEQIVMGAELTDLEINFAQQLLKQQFKEILHCCKKRQQTSQLVQWKIVSRSFIVKVTGIGY